MTGDVPDTSGSNSARGDLVVIPGHNATATVRLNDNPELKNAKPVLLTMDYRRAKSWTQGFDSIEDAQARGEELVAKADRHVGEDDPSMWD